MKHHRLCGSDGTSRPQTSLSAAQSLITLDDILALLDNLVTLGKDQLNVAWVAHVWVDTTVGTVCATTLLWCLVDLDVLDEKVAGVEALGVGVGFGVLEEREEELGGLDWVAGTGDTELLALCASSNTTSVSVEWDNLLQFLDVLEVLDGTVDLHAVDGLGGLTGVLERDTEV